MAEQASDTRQDQTRTLRLQALLTEYEALRREMGQRADTQRAFVILAVSAVGAVLSLSVKEAEPMILLAVPFVLPISLAVWQEHAASIAGAGHYIRRHLAQRIAEVTDDATSGGWQAFFRTPTSRTRWRGGRFMFVWLHILFGAVPTATLVVALVSAVSEGLKYGFEELSLPVWAFATLWLCALALTAWGWITLAAARAFHRQEYGG